MVAGSSVANRLGLEVSPVPVHVKVHNAKVMARYEALILFILIPLILIPLMSSSPVSPDTKAKRVPHLEKTGKVIIIYRLIVELSCIPGRGEPTKCLTNAENFMPTIGIHLPIIVS